MQPYRPIGYSDEQISLLGFRVIAIYIYIYILNVFAFATKKREKYEKKDE